MTRIVIGLGNPLRGDDAAGAAVLRRLGFGVMAEPFELIDIWEGADDVIVVDAARSGAPPGTIHRFEVGTHPLPTGTMSTSTHSVGVSEVVALARALHRLPARLVVYGIEAGDMSHDAALTPEVAAAVREVAEEIRSA